MMHSRLRLARNLLTDDGVIFISIDDNEQANLKRLCDEVFGEQNFVETLVWKRRATPPNDRVIGKNHEYCLVYARRRGDCKLYLQKRDERLNSRYKNPDNDPKGRWVASDLSANGKGGRLSQSTVFKIVNPVTGEAFYPPENKSWLYNKEKIQEYLTEGRIGFRESTGTPFLKRYLFEVRQGATLPTILDMHGYSQDSAKEIKKIFKKDVLDFPKPIKFIWTLLYSGLGQNDIILDFFAGSSTTAHAVMQLNAEDGGNRKFIMVQLPEATDEKSEAYKAGYQTIAEISKERIRRAGKQILESENIHEDWNRDIGFRVLKVDSSNMKEVYYQPQELTQADLLDQVDNVKEDRTPEDLLFQVMLDWGLELSLPITTEEIEGKKVFFVADDALIACFDAGITESLVKTLAERAPLRLLFRDNHYLNNDTKINAEQLIKQIAPNTELKSI